MEKRGGRGWENFGNVSIKFIDPPIRLCNILMTPPPPRQQLVGSQFSLQTLLATTDPPCIPPQNHATPPPPSTSFTSSLGKKFWLVLFNPILLVILCLADTLAKRPSQRSCERLHFQLLDRKADTKCYHLSAPTTRESSTNILRYCTVISTVG